MKLAVEEGAKLPPPTAAESAGDDSRGVGLTGRRVA